MFKIGDRIQNRYQIMDIKMGGMGIVYLSFDHERKQKIAIKTFRDEYITDTDTKKRFMSEADTWINLEKHTNIVFARYFKLIDDKPYIFLEYIDGSDLSDYCGKIDIPYALDYAIQFCTGMNYAYQKIGAIHRDIKPHNALISKNNTLKITDFGLVKALGEKVIIGDIDLTNLVVSRGIGTPLYMPPEQFPIEIQEKLGFPYREITVQSDIYSFGVTMYELVTGELPFSEPIQIFFDNPIHPNIMSPHIPPELNDLIMRCLSKDSTHRYTNWEQLIHDLLKIYYHQPIEKKVFGEIYTIRSRTESLTEYEWLDRAEATFDLDRYASDDGCLIPIDRELKAPALCDKAIELNPLSSEAWYKKGLILTKSVVGNMDIAIECLNKALEIDPSLDYDKDAFAEAWFTEAEAQRRRENFQEAIDCLDKSISMKPEIHKYIKKGFLLKKLGRHEEESQCYEKALSMSVHEPQFWGLMGHISYLDHCYQDALIYLDKAIAINPNFGILWSTKAQVLLTLGLCEEALRCTDEAISLNQEDASYWHLKSSILKKLGREMEASQCHDIAEEHESKNAE
jgi:serine/threonine protein kinase/Tfp pilus assembly protein PilF